MTNLATKNGSLIVKDGSIAENCGCCGEDCTPFVNLFYVDRPVIRDLAQVTNWPPYPYITSLYRLQVTIANVQPAGAGFAKTDSSKPWLIFSQDGGNTLAIGLTPIFGGAGWGKGVELRCGAAYANYLSAYKYVESQIKYNYVPSYSFYEPALYELPAYTCATIDAGLCFAQYGFKAGNETRYLVRAGSAVTYGWATPSAEVLCVLDKNTKAANMLVTMTGWKNFSGGSTLWLHDQSGKIATGFFVQFQTPSIFSPFSVTYSGVECANIFEQSFSWIADFTIECVQLA